MAKDTTKPKKVKKQKKEKTPLDFKTFMSFVKGYRVLTILTPFMIFFDVLIQLQIPKIMGQIIDLVYKTNDADFSYGELRMKLLEMLGLCFVTLLVGYFASRFSAISSMGFGANMRSALFNKIQDLSFDNINKLKISSLITRMTSDTSMIQNVFSTTITTFIKGPFMLIMALRYALNISTDLSKIFIFAVPGILFTLILLGIICVPLFKEMLEKTDKFNGTLRGNINGIRVVKSFVREDYEREKFEGVNVAVAKANMKAQKLILYISPLLAFIIYACMIVTLYKGSHIIILDKLAGISGGLTTGQMSSFISYISEVLSAFMTVLMVFVTMTMARASMSRVGEVFHQKVTVTDENGDPDLLVENGSVEFKNVYFKYNDSADKEILSDVSFKINSGEMIGIIGSTGSSKSTLISLIPRLYDASQGDVFVGGRNVKDYKFKNLRNGVSVVLQENILFSGTIKDNIQWGNFDASEDEIIEAAKAAQAHDFIMEKENGYDTELGQGGNTVSGGQKQRLCIARAFLKKPKVLILDDSTSAVDTATDTKIRTALRGEAFEGITKIIIAQRITSIMDADRIIVIEDGKINGIGTHEELVENNEVYKEIFVSQQEGVLAQ